MKWQHWLPHPIFKRFTQRKELTLRVVEDAVRRLQEACKKVNFCIIAKESGLVKATLYKHTEVRQLITHSPTPIQTKKMNERKKR